MKRIYSFIFAAAAIFAAASCQKEMANETLQKEGGDFSITATIGADTKTVLSDDAEGNKIYWAPGDQISIFNAEGAEVVFSTDIAANSQAAKFTNDTEFVKPEGKLVAIYPTRTDRVSTFDAATGDITNLHIGGTVQAVAGSFDSKYAPAVGVADSETPDNMTFNNVHCLIKFTIGGTTAPETVVLKNNGLRAICGIYDYNITTGEIVQGGGNPYINVTGPFAVGETYYIPMIPGNCANGLSLEFDGQVVKNTGVTKTLEKNKIYNLGTVERPSSEEPEQPEEPFAERVWGKYTADGSNLWWKNGPESLDDRNMTMDDKFVYVANSTTDPAIHKFNITDGAYAGEVNVTGMETGTHPVSVVKIVKNTDAAINGGKDLLVACNLTIDGAALQIWAWENGVDAAPVKKYSLAAARRFGDKMNFSGTWQSGRFWFRSNEATQALVATIPVNNGSVQSWIDAYRMTLEDYSCMSDVFWYPQANSTVADYCLIGTNSSKGLYLMSGTSAAGAGVVNTKYEKLKNTLGVNFFEYKSVKYAAWVSMAQGGDKPRLQIVELDGSSLATLKAGLDAYPTNVVFEAPIQSESDFAASGAFTGVNADCAVRVINGEIYIAAMAWKNGLSLFKVTEK